MSSIISYVCQDADEGRMISEILHTPLHSLMFCLLHHRNACPVAEKHIEHAVRRKILYKIRKAVILAPHDKRNKFLIASGIQTAVEDICS